MNLTLQLSDDMGMMAAMRSSSSRALKITPIEGQRHLSSVEVKP
ncbi:MAG TPA: hypothetical protein VLE02_05160 [Nitrosarchaeum sp.]|nr:hypothetical protein [Nitrosarchaeum sp.]